MDLRAFGSTYPYSASVPYTSGFGVAVTASGSSAGTFAACRAIFIQAKDGGAGGYLAVQLADAPGQAARADNLHGDTLYPISCTAVLSGSVGGVFVLY